MEYLEIRGAVILKTNADMSVVQPVLSVLRAIDYVDAGYVDIRITDQVLSIRAEGTVSDSDSIRLSLTKLQDQLAASSVVDVSRVRWETTIALKHRGPIPTIRRPAISQLILAQ